MGLRWTSKAHSDLVRLHGFIEPVSPAAAARAMRAILVGVRQIAEHPRLGKRLSEFDPHEVRRLIAADYEIRYEVRGDQIFILRVWQVHEDR